MTTIYRNGLLWFWIGHHTEYDKILKEPQNFDASSSVLPINGDSTLDHFLKLERNDQGNS